MIINDHCKNYEFSLFFIFKYRVVNIGVLVIVIISLLLSY